MGRKGLDRDRRSAADLAGQHYPRRDGRPHQIPIDGKPPRQGLKARGFLLEGFRTPAFSTGG